MEEQDKIKEAKEILAKEKEIKEKEFLREYEELCKKYDIQIVPIVQLTLKQTNNECI